MTQSNVSVSAKYLSDIFGIQFNLSASTYLLHLVSVQLICFIWSSSNRQIPFQWHKLIYFISYPLKWITSNGTN